MQFNLAPVFKSQGLPVSFGFSREIGKWELNGETLAFTTPVRFEGTVVQAEDVFVIEGEITASYRATCGRCGEEAPGEIQIAVGEEYARAEDEEHPDRYLFEGDVIDFFPMVEETIALNIPLKHLCRADCRGICPVCRTNWNYATCGCQAQTEEGETSNPFAALRALMGQEDEEE